MAAQVPPAAPPDPSPSPPPPAEAAAAREPPQQLAQFLLQLLITNKCTINVYADLLTVWPSV